MDTFQTSLPMMLHRTLDAIIPRYREVFKDHDISEQQWRILRVLWEAQHCTTAELARRTLLPHPSMVGIIDRMQAKDMVVRDRSSTDRRKVHVRLTKKGEKMQDEIMPKIDEVYQSMMGCCEPKQWNKVINTLQLIIDSNQTKN